MSDKTPRLDLSTPAAKRDAAQALPVLMLGAALGSTEAAGMAGQIIGQAFADALAPSIAALARLQGTNRSETFAERMARQSVEAMEAQKAADRTNRSEETR